MSSTPIPGLGLSIAFCTMGSLGHLPGCFAEAMPSTTVPPSALHGAEFSCFSLSQLFLYLSPILLTPSLLHRFSSDLQTTQRIHGTPLLGRGKGHSPQPDGEGSTQPAPALHPLGFLGRPLWAGPQGGAKVWWQEGAGQVMSWNL